MSIQYFLRNKILTKLVVATIFLLSLTWHALSQGNDSTRISKNSVYLDLASKGALYSINFDRIFYQGLKLNYSYRIGFSILKDVIALPFGLSFFTGRQNRHLEISITIMPYIDQYKSFLSPNDLSDSFIYLISGIAYRYQKLKGGVFFKTTFSPMLILDPRSNNFWDMDPQVNAAINVSMGWSF